MRDLPRLKRSFGCGDLRGGWGFHGLHRDVEERVEMLGERNRGSGRENRMRGKSCQEARGAYIGLSC
jgi:hypothetical protein